MLTLLAGRVEIQRLGQMVHGSFAGTSGPDACRAERGERQKDRGNQRAGSDVRRIMAWRLRL